MSEALVRVRMLRTIDQLPIVLEVRMGEDYSLPATTAQHLVEVGSAEFVTESPRLEAAAFAAPRRRG